MHIRKSVFFSCWVKCCIYSCYIQLVYNVVQVLYLFINLCLMLLFIIERKTLIKIPTIIIELSISLINYFNVIYMSISISISIYLQNEFWGTWVAQSVERPASAQVMMSVRGFKPHVRLCADRSTSFSVSLSLSQK